MSDEPSFGDAKPSLTREEKQRLAKQAHWQRFKAEKKRVYGTLTHAEYTAVKRRADKNDRSVWGQIWAESRACSRVQFLPSKQIEARITELHVELRRIGNNLNQIAKKSNIAGYFTDALSVKKHIQKLEHKIADFTRRPWLK